MDVFPSRWNVAEQQIIKLNKVLNNFVEVRHPETWIITHIFRKLHHNTDWHWYPQTKSGTNPTIIPFYIHDMETDIKETRKQQARRLRLDALVTLLLATKDESKRLDRQAETGTHKGGYSNLKKSMMISVPGAAKLFAFKIQSSDCIDLRDYQYHVLRYGTNRLSRWKYDAYSYTGNKGFERYRMWYILKIWDNNDCPFYLFVRLKYQANCDSCDGDTRYQQMYMRYSDDLRTLLAFALNDSEQKQLHHLLN